jgi:glycosyltransferase involved in cell wall biosynthesis
MSALLARMVGFSGRGRALTEPFRPAHFTQAYCDALPRFDRGLSWLCWAYNEEGLIAEYLRRADDLLRRTVEDYEIVVVDDGSTDRTPAVLTELAREIPSLRVVTNETNRNVGYSCRRAIMAAGKEYLMWQTVDWSYDVTLLRAFLELLKAHDVVAGVRRAPVQQANRIHRVTRGLLGLFGIRHITRRSDTIPKALVSVINYLLVRALFRVPLSDFQNVCIYPTGLIQSMEKEAESSFLNPEMLLKAYWSGCSIVEVPISFIPRQAGQAKGTQIRAIRASVRDIFRLWVKWILLKRGPSRGRGTVRRLVRKEWPPDAIS